MGMRWPPFPSRSRSAAEVLVALAAPGFDADAVELALLRAGHTLAWRVSDVDEAMTQLAARAPEVLVVGDHPAVATPSLIGACDLLGVRACLLVATGVEPSAAAQRLGLLDVLLPSLYFGVPVLASRARKFDPEAAFELMARHRVRNAFLPPTALKMLRSVPDAGARFKPAMRSIASGGETLGAELLDWGRETFGLAINEFYGQTECNMIVSSCARIMPGKPGIMGRPAFGHDVAVIDDDGNRLEPGRLGNIAVRRPDPVMFLQYWRNPEATQAKFIGDWLVTGDQGMADEEGYLRFVGRDDDVITSAGYRIGPGEIEDCLIGHPAVRMAAVVGVPDPLRTEIVMAFVVLHDGVTPDDALRRAIQEHVKVKLAAHEYPREIAFVDSLPMTTTGKIVRRELRDRAVAERTG